MTDYYNSTNSFIHHFRKQYVNLKTRSEASSCGLRTPTSHHAIASPMLREPPLRTRRSPTAAGQPATPSVPLGKGWGSGRGLLWRCSTPLRPPDRVCVIFFLPADQIGEVYPEMGEHMPISLFSSRPQQRPDCGGNGSRARPQRRAQRVYAASVAGGEIREWCRQEVVVPMVANWWWKYAECRKNGSSIMLWMQRLPPLAVSNTKLVAS